MYRLEGDRTIKEVDKAVLTEASGSLEDGSGGDACGLYEAQGIIPRHEL